MTTGRRTAGRSRLESVCRVPEPFRSARPIPRRPNTELSRTDRIRFDIVVYKQLCLAVVVTTIVPYPQTASLVRLIFTFCEVSREVVSSPPPRRERVILATERYCVSVVRRPRDRCVRARSLLSTEFGSNRFVEASSRRIRPVPNGTIRSVVVETLRFSHPRERWAPCTRRVSG